MVLGDLQGRVRAMSLLHENLYRSGNLTGVGVPSYLRSLCQHALRAGFDQRVGSVDLKVDVAPLHMEMGQAIPCGLLVNELVTNCLKHAFPRDRGGVVEVALRPADGSNLWRLAVSDNGVGLPDDFASKDRRSLGMQLISDLGRQLQGHIEWESVLGTRFTLMFTPRKGGQEIANGVVHASWSSRTRPSWPTISSASWSDLAIVSWRTHPAERKPSSWWRSCGPISC
jgi:two-component sensor histidine kinase